MPFLHHPFADQIGYIFEFGGSAGSPLSTLQLQMIFPAILRKVSTLDRCSCKVASWLPNLVWGNRCFADEVVIDVICGV